MSKNKKTIKKVKITWKQAEALTHLQDDERKMILFWWWAWWAKSYLWCLWLLMQCTNFADVRYAMCRKVKDRLKTTTLKTFFKVTKDLWLKQWVEYKYNIKFQ